MRDLYRQTKDDIAVENNKTRSGAALLNLVFSRLPQHAEEGRQRDCLSEKELITTILDQEGVEEETARLLIYSLRRQFEALCLLDSFELRKGNWAFVSFPASLLGKSWLMTLATPEQTLLPSDYWEQGDSRPIEIKEEQRMLLHRMEAGRLKFNPQAKTIRTVHVAWAFIRLGDKFLLHRREDKMRSGEKSYVLPGGRFNLSDLPSVVQESNNILKEILNTESDIVSRHITSTLERELEEEVKLQHGIHYSYKPCGHPLPIYCEINGAGNRHAYTSYKFYLYQIKLTQSGETHLFDKVENSSGALTWFTIDDILGSQRADGKSAYVDALSNAWGSQMKKQLCDIPDSSASPLSYTEDTSMLDLPSHSEGKFFMGRPGKEKPLMTTSKLDDEEWELLMLLGWHRRGFLIQETKGIRLLESGWLDASAAIQVAKNLQGKTHEIVSDLIEIREDRYLALSIAPAIVFFAVDLFHYSITGSNKAGGAFRIERKELQTPWGFLQGGFYEKEISGKTVTTLRNLEKGDDPDGDWERNLREQFGEGVRGIGLRRLWSKKGNTSCLVAGLQRTSAC